MQITDPAIVAAATFSHRYIADRQLPDKAIDLIMKPRPASVCRLTRNRGSWTVDRPHYPAQAGTAGAEPRSDEASKETPRYAQRRDWR
ncbi:hypothetical protein ACNKHS_15820 [Shigella flexneri]